MPIDAMMNCDWLTDDLCRRTWRSRNFVAFWISDSFNINTWYVCTATLDVLSQHKET